MDGNGGADYCRRVDSPSNQRYQCSLASPEGFTMQSAGQALEWGDVNGTALADATGDGKADFCRVTADQAICSPLTADGFGPGFSTPVDPGPVEGRAWVDVNADGKADFCRVLGRADLRAVLRQPARSAGRCPPELWISDTRRVAPGRTSTATVAPTTAARSATAARTSA